MITPEELSTELTTLRAAFAAAQAELATLRAAFPPGVAFADALSPYAPHAEDEPILVLVRNHDLAVLRRNYNDALAAAARWRNKYQAAHDVLLHVAEFCERGVVRQGIDTGIDMGLYRAMAAALAAYRQSIEAGALPQSPAYLQFIAAGAVTPAMAAALMAGDLDA